MAAILFCLWMAIPASWYESANAFATRVERSDAVKVVVDREAHAAPSTRQLRTAAISSIRVGQRVLADDPELAGESLADTAIEPADWRLFQLKMDRPVGADLEIELLRPELWMAVHALDGLAFATTDGEQTEQLSAILQDYTAAQGRKIYLTLPELGAVGFATIVDVLPCPEIESNNEGGPRRTVTGTFCHDASDIIDLDIAGEESSVGVTSEHPFWSVDRNAYIPAGDLREGELLLCADGTTTQLRASNRRVATEVQVFNLEVDVDHVYYIGDTGVLVHNAYWKYGKPHDIGGNGQGPLHHIVTYFANTRRIWPNNINYAKKAQDLLDAANFNGTVKQLGINRMHLPDHFGPHPVLYHQRVFERLDDAISNFAAGSPEYAKAVSDELGAIAADLFHDVSKLSGVGL